MPNDVDRAVKPEMSTNNKAPLPGLALGWSQLGACRFDRMSLTLGEVGGQTSSNSACTEAGENFAKEFNRSVRFRFRSRRFFFDDADWGRQLQYLTVDWAGSSSSSACFGDEKKPMAALARRPPLSY